LPAPDFGAGEVYVAPAGFIEVTLAALWQEVLGLSSPVSATANFFALGGHSLLLIRLIHAVAEQFSTRLTIKEVFQQPTVRALAALLQDRSATVDTGPTHAPHDAPIPLSLCQFRIWYVEQMRDAKNEHSMPVAMTLRGDVDPASLRKALATLVERHPALRTRLLLDQHTPLQQVEQHLDVALEYHDLADVPAAEREPRIAAVLAPYDGRVFDIYDLPLFCAVLVRVAPGEYRFHVNFHHLVFDGWSFTVFVDELFRAYEMHAERRVPELPALPFDHLDFAEWQMRWLRGTEAEEQRTFWHDYLQDCPDPLSLPGQGLWRRDASPGDGRIATSLDAATRDALAALARRHRTSLFSVLYSAFALLLSRLAGQGDLVIGIPVTGRHLPGSQNVIGNFLNNLPVRNQIRLDEPFSAYLTRQVGNIEQVLSNQDYPFEKILELAPHARKRDTTPLFQVFFNMLSLPSRDAAPQAFEVAFDGAPEVEAKFDLTLYLRDHTDGVSMTCHYAKAAYAHAAIGHVLSQYLHLLDQIGADAARHCGEYSLRPGVPVEARRDLEPQRYWPGAVQDIFRQRSLERPDAVAIVEADQEWTYGEVLRASTILARRLSEAGAAAGGVVAIVAARKACMVIGVLATLQTGAAFSLLNPEYPVERVRLLADILAPACLLFAGEAAAFADDLRERLAPVCVNLHLSTRKSVLCKGDADGFVPAAVEPEQLACVTFTSGTTGTPKAVAGIHIGLAGYLEWVPAWLEFSTADRFAMFSGLGHDPIQRDMFGPLCNGATLVIPDAEVFAPHVLARWLIDNEITFVHMTPAMAQILCSTDETCFDRLRVTFLTGEKLHSDAVARLLRYNGKMRILNSYGTTETQRAVTYFEASLAVDYQGVIPAGESAPDAVLRVLNSMGTPCGVGEIGEIFIESYHLSKGYRNDPELTAKVLTELGGGRRRYRTGDVGCRLADGTVMCLGRKDGQINIRGFRVETGEIESHARRLEAIKDAVVLPMRKEEGGDLLLVAYVVPADRSFNEKQVRAHVLEHFRNVLPAHMVPSAIMPLAQLPLTPNGKLDRRELPQPHWKDEESYVAPRTELEQSLAAIWEEVLRVEKVGVHDSFVELGGHSMLMVLMMSQLSERLHVEFNLGDLLRCTTVAEQARLLEKPAA
jgi:amino acid adenylation domain-containing protein